MWRVPFVRQRCPVVGAPRLCWVLRGSFDSCCCPPHLRRPPVVHNLPRCVLVCVRPRCPTPPRVVPAVQPLRSTTPWVVRTHDAPPPPVPTLRSGHLGGVPSEPLRLGKGDVRGPGGPDEALTQPNPTPVPTNELPAEHPMSGTCPAAGRPSRGEPPIILTAGQGLIAVRPHAAVGTCNRSSPLLPAQRWSPVPLQRRPLCRTPAITRKAMIRVSLA